jgi:1-acyl-sn-glycerol-3-phosphate acyltransferase
MESFFKKVGITVSCSGLENLNGIRLGVFVSNHGSFLDIMVIMRCLNAAFKTIGKSSIADTPIFGEIYKAGTVLIDLTPDENPTPEEIAHSNESKKKGFKQMIKLMQMGVSTLFFPEGTRNTQKEKLLEFEDGAFTLAVMQNVPVIPIAISGARELMPPGSGFTPGHIHISILPPIYPQHFIREGKKERVDDIKNAAWRAIHAAL